jgi:hypothetical protein
MTDLIERLRHHSVNAHQVKELDVEYLHELFGRSADEIERLQSEAACNYCGEYHGKEVCESLLKRIAELEHKQFHLLWMLETAGIDSTAAKDAECILGTDCPYFQEVDDD